MGSNDALMAHALFERKFAIVICVDQGKHSLLQCERCSVLLLCKLLVLLDGEETAPIVIAFHEDVV